MHAALVAVIAPLFGAFFCVFSGWAGGKREHWIALTALALSATAALDALLRVLKGGPQTYLLGNWPAPFGIAYTLDPLACALVFLIAAGALLNLWGARREIAHRYPEKDHTFYALYLLAAAGHMGMVVTGDVFNFYVLIEITALSCYALISMGSERSELASLNYLLLGAAGASLYLLGVGFLYIKTGTLNLPDMAAILPAMATAPAVGAALALILLGVAVKMGLFPFHGWLPGAYGEAPAVAAGLVAPMTTKVMAYVLVRFQVSLFPPEFLRAAPALPQIMVWLSVAAILLGAVMALYQKNLRRMLCFIVLAEVGYMAGGLFLGNRDALTGTVLHIYADLAMTLCVFMAAANIERRRGSLAFEKLRGLFGTMPWTMAGLTAGALSMIGVPPFCGFFSKWYLIKGGMAAGHWPFVAALVLSSLVNVLLFFRVFEIAFFEKDERPGLVAGDVSAARLVPLAAVALSLPLLGLATGQIVERVVVPLLAPLT